MVHQGNDHQDASSATTEEEPDRRGGGTGLAGGTELHAKAMVIAAAHLLRGTRIGWLNKVIDDTPVAITAETGGPGDDIGLELAGGEKVEVQSKKNLQKGDDLWGALEGLVDGIARKKIDCGILLVNGESSGNIRDKLAQDIVKIGQGVEGSLSEIGGEWLARLKATGRNPAHCASLRIVTIRVSDTDGADRRNALEAMRWVCLKEEDAEHSLNHLYEDAITLMKARGRWTLPSIVRLLRAAGIGLRHDETPSGMIVKLATWVEAIHGTIHLPAAVAKLKVAAMLPPVVFPFDLSVPKTRDPLTALFEYHERDEHDSDTAMFNGEWIGRFHRLNVIVAGPGMGKSTLAQRLAWEYASDTIPVLIVSLKRVAALLKGGWSFSDSLFAHGLDGAHISASDFRRYAIRRFVLIADGLDEAGPLHDEVARRLEAFAAGHPGATIVVTTRPIGYDTRRLADWRHYRLDALGDDNPEGSLADLIVAAGGADKGDEALRQQIKDELSSVGARRAIAARPLMLGMAAALIIRDKRLPDTKTKLYEAMIDLFEARDAEGRGVVSSKVAERVLDILGWELTGNPIQSWGDTEAKIRSRLANELGLPPLSAAERFEQSLLHWERAGVVEKLNFENRRLLTFVHKTFAEFAAARFLVAIGPGWRQEAERIIDAPEYQEVIAFAGGLGLGNELAQLYVDRWRSGGAGQIERALELAGDRDAEVDASKAVELATIAFTIIASGSTDRFSIGAALAALAKNRPDSVGPLAAQRLEDNNVSVRLVAWACAVNAGAEFYDPSRLKHVLGTLKLAIKPAKYSFKGLFPPHQASTDVDLLQSIAIATLRAQPVGHMIEFVESYFSAVPFTNMGFIGKIEAVLQAHGLSRQHPHNLRQPSVDAIASFLQPNEWTQAANKAMRAIAEAILDGSSASPKQMDHEPRRLLQFSALTALVGFAEVEARDVYKWESAYDKAAVREAVIAVVRLSKIDAVDLAVEARSIISRLDRNPHIPLVFQLGQADISKPDWSRASSLGLDRNLVEKAFHHGSRWLTIIAANLLANMPASTGECVRLLADSSGDTLFYASSVVSAVVDVPTSRAMLQNRSQERPYGVEHLLMVLKKLDESSL